MEPSSAPRRAVFLDRDGTIIEDADYLTNVDQMRLMPGAAEAIRRLNDAGLVTVVVTNQSAVARGMMSERALSAVHEHLRGLLAAHGARVDAIYYCPHHPEIGDAPYRIACDCRKPQPGLLRRAAADLTLSLSDSAVIGDSLRDLEAGDAAGCHTLVLVRTGHGAAEEAALRAARLTGEALVCDDLAAAVALAVSALTPEPPDDPAGQAASIDKR